MPAERILIFRTGSLGDTLVSVPAMVALGEHYRGSRLDLLCDRVVGSSFVQAREILEGSQLVDDFLLYPVDSSMRGKILGPLRMLPLLLRLRLRRYHKLVYLRQSRPSLRQISRDRCFFYLAGIREFIGVEGSEGLPEREPGSPLPRLPHEADTLLSRLRRSGVPIPQPGQGRWDLSLGEAEERAVENWLPKRRRDSGCSWIAVGPGTKMPAKQWPVERFEEVIAQLIEEQDIWPVVFGGPEDRETALSLVSRWRRGYVAAGELGVRPAMSALRRCKLFVGNDTGTMHMAAAAGVPCVAVFSSRDFPGKWEPYGAGHAVLRTPIDCEGCMLQECVERRMECILSISAERVLRACREILRARATGSTSMDRGEGSRTCQRT